MGRGPQIAILFLLGLAGCLLRINGCLGDLWLDEIWSLQAATSVSSLRELVTSSTSDNNHLLNSILLYELGPHRAAWIYRLQALLFGIGSLPLMWYVARPLGERTALYSFYFLSLSHVAVLYSSEARGYAGAAFFALASVLLLRKIANSFRPVWLLLLWLSFALGSLSHYSFWLFYPALGLWSIPLLFDKKKLWFLSVLHSFPCAFAALLYAAHMRRLAPGTGPLRPSIEVLIESLATPFGALPLTTEMPAINLIPALLAAFVLAAAMVELFKLGGRNDRFNVLLTAVIFIVPVAVVVFSGPRVLFLRYFYVPIIFLFIVMAAYLSRIRQRGRFGQAVCVAYLLLFLVGQGYQTWRFMQYGRGGYAQALRLIQSSSDSADIAICSNHDFRGRILVNYYAGNDNRVRYITGEAGRNICPGQWHIIQSVDPFFRPPPSFNDDEGREFRLVGSYPFAGLSGAGWFVFRRADSGTAVAG